MAANGSYTVTLEEATDVARVGGKAVNLAAMIRAGFPVPGGFVITTAAFREQSSARSAIEAAIREAYQRLVAAQNSGLRTQRSAPAVAVRSSATAEDMAGASMAGQYETYLDIVGEEGVLEAVGKCWASVSSPRTQAYFREHGIDPAGVAMAVVVQILVPAQVAGVMFTVNPRTAEENEILIEASYGLGEAVVSGLVQPDTIVLDKETGAIKSCLVGTKEVAIEAGSHAQQAVSAELRAARCLSEEQLQQLRVLAMRAQAHFGSPQDIEWAFAGGSDEPNIKHQTAKLAIYLLQSRAVTTLAGARARTAMIDQTREALRQWKKEGRGDWARHNLGETLPQPTPLTWSVMERFMSAKGGFATMYRMAGYAPSARLAPPHASGFLDLVAGRIFMDLSRAPEMFYEGFPFRYDLNLLRWSPGAAQEAPTIAVMSAGSLLRFLRIGRRLKRAARHLADLARDFDHTLDQRLIPQFRQWIARESGRDLAALEAAQWLDIWRARERRIMDDFAPASLLPSLICGMALENLRAFLEPHLWEGEGKKQEARSKKLAAGLAPHSDTSEVNGASNRDASVAANTTETPEELANLLAAGGPADATLRSNEALYRVATGKLALEAWLKENGHRAPEEFDLAAPRWRERPEAVMTLAQHLVGGADPGDEHRARREEADARVAGLHAALGRRDRVLLDQHVALARRYLRFREDGKHELMRGYELLRQMVLDAGRRLRLEPGDVCLLSFEELGNALRAGAAPAEMIAARRLERSVQARLSLPDLITPDQIDTVGELHLPEHTDRLDAFALSTGTCSGRVRIVASPESAGELGTGYILVCRSTDPSWTPLFVNAAGIVLECGGALSHGAVVAREMGKPAVVLPNATQLLKEDQQIAVDANQGAVFLADLPAADSPSAEIENRKSKIENPLDTRIAWRELPPVAGARERSAARLRNVAALFWGIFFVAVFVFPQTHLRELSFGLLDEILWPIFRDLGGLAGRGGLATVAVIAVTFALLSMVGQWALTDTPRLREAKRRAAALRKQAGGLSADSPRRKKLLAAAAPVQTRLMLAAFVPLAVLLGPMVMSFLWLPERIDPASANPRPGATAIITALVDPDYSGPVTLSADRALAPRPMGQMAAAIRPTLTGLAAQLRSGQMPAAAAGRLAQSGKSAAELAADLQHFLGAPLPPQALTWTIATPADRPAIYSIAVSAGAAEPVAAGEQALSAELILGDVAPPPLSIETDEKGNRIEVVAGMAGAMRDSPGEKASTIRALRIRYSDSRRADEHPFFAPLAPLGLHYDFGWLGVYVLAYLVTLVPARLLLRIP